MSNDTDLVAIRARWVLPADQPPIPDGLVTLEAGRIVAVGRNESGRPARDLGNVVVLPGLVNAHTHLEFSELAAPLGEPHMSFAEWIGSVVAYRRSQVTEGGVAGARTKSVRAGLNESRQCGTTLVGDIATEPWTATALNSAGPRGVVFHEILGLGADRIEPLLDSARDFVAERSADDPRILPAGWSVGLSPHAPYTVHFELLKKLVELSARSRVPLAMHLAETLEELELLGSHSGPLVERLRSLDAWHPDAVPRGIRPGDYLQQLAHSHRTLVVHGNYLGDDDYQTLANNRDRMSLVFCPRTHDYFGHGHYRLDDMLQAGVRVALGTDSRASNPDLDLLAELRFVAQRYEGIDPRELLRMATLSGAEALGLDQTTGSITRSKRADLTIVDLPDNALNDPYGFLWSDHVRVRAVVCGGCFFGPDDPHLQSNFS